MFKAKLLFLYNGKAIILCRCKVIKEYRYKHNKDIVNLSQGGYKDGFKKI
jgi:hypothetical protein